MYLCKWEAEVDYFLCGSQNRWFRVKLDIFEEAANNAVEQVRGEAIQVK